MGLEELVLFRITAKYSQLCLQKLRHQEESMQKNNEKETFCPELPDIGKSISFSNFPGFARLSFWYEKYYENKNGEAVEL